MHCYFIVVNGSGANLLGKCTAEKLGVLHVGPGVVNLDNDIIARYKLLSNGVGMLKNYRLKLHVDVSIKSVAQPLRRIPFQLRDKVDFKLNELLESDIIEEVLTALRNGYRCWWLSPKAMATCEFT